MLLRRTWVVLVTSLLGLLLPIFIDLPADWKHRPFGYAAADTFYYLNIARNFSRTGVFSYDGAHAVNGFHPLWQLIVGVFHTFADRLHAAHAMVLVVIVASALLVGGALYLCGRALAGRGELTPWFALLPVGGLYGLCAARMWLACGDDLVEQNAEGEALPVFGTLWSYVNGMETGLVLLFFGLAWYLHVHAPAWASRRNAVWTGLALAGLSLARLDHTIFALLLVGGLAWRVDFNPRERPRQLEVMLAWLLPLGAYLTLNWVYFRSPIPMSGAAKSSFPWVTIERLDYLRDLLEKPGNGRWLAVAFRELQMLFPLGVAILFLLLVLRVRRLPQGAVVGMREGGGPSEGFLALTACGVIALAFYNFLFVKLWEQGHWYFPVSTLFVTLAPLALLSRERWFREPPRWAVALILIACSALSATAFLKLHRRLDYHQTYARFYWEEAPRIRAHYKQEVPRLLEHDDGIVAYALGYPTMSWTGLALDREAMAGSYAERFKIAYDRGFNRITSLSYETGHDVKKNSTSEQLRLTNLAKTIGNDVSQYDFAVDYLSPSGHFAILKATRR